MKYAYIGGPLAYFEGYEFIRGKAVDVTNPATLERIKNKPQFVKVEHVPESKEEIPVPDKNSCPKCGRVIRQGMFIHQKYCKGNK